MKRKREAIDACSAYAHLKSLIEWLNEVAICVYNESSLPHPSMHRRTPKTAIGEYPSGVIGANPPPSALACSQEVKYLCGILKRAVETDDGVAASALVSDGFLDTLADLISTKCELPQLTTYHLGAARLVSSIALSSLQNTHAVGAHTRLLHSLSAKLNHANLSLVQVSSTALADGALSSAGEPNVANPYILHQTLQAMVCLQQNQSGESRLSYHVAKDPFIEGEKHPIALTHSVTSSPGVTCDTSEISASDSDGEEDSSCFSESEEEEDSDAMLSNTLQRLVTLAERIVCGEEVSTCVFRNIPKDLVHRCLSLLQRNWRLLGTARDKTLRQTASKLVVRLGAEVSIQETGEGWSVKKQSSMSSINTAFLKTHWEKSAVLLHSDTDNHSDSFPAMTNLHRCSLLHNSRAVLEKLLPLCHHCPSPPADEVNVTAMVNVVGKDLGGGRILGHDINLVKTASSKTSTTAAQAKRIGYQESGVLCSGNPGTFIQAPQSEGVRKIPVQNGLSVSEAVDENETFWKMSQSRVAKTEEEDEEEGEHTRVSPEECKRAFSEGYSIAMRSVQDRIPEVAEVACQLASHLGQAAVGANLYLTPPNAQGLKLHYDDHCVFVCQLAGRKRWRVYPPSGKLPRLYAAREDPGRKGEAEEFVLRRGEVLYIPRGCPHEALTFSTDHEEFRTSSSARSAGSVKEAIEEDGASLHVTFGVEVEMPFTWEGFIHLSLHQWAEDNAARLLSIISVQGLSEQTTDGEEKKGQASESSAILLLLHAVVRQVADDDEAFKKACLVGGGFEEETRMVEERAVATVDRGERPFSTDNKIIEGGWVEEEGVEMLGGSEREGSEICRSAGDNEVESVLLQTKANDAGLRSHADGDKDGETEVGSEHGKFADSQDQFEILIQKVKAKAKWKEALHMLLDEHRGFWDVEWIQWLYRDEYHKVGNENKAFRFDTAFTWLQTSSESSNIEGKLVEALSSFALAPNYCRSKNHYCAFLRAFQNGRRHFTQGMLALQNVDVIASCQAIL